MRAEQKRKEMGCSVWAVGDRLGEDWWVLFAVEADAEAGGWELFGGLQPMVEMKAESH